MNRAIYILLAVLVAALPAGVVVTNKPTTPPALPNAPDVATNAVVSTNAPAKTWTTGHFKLNLDVAPVTQPTLIIEQSADLKHWMDIYQAPALIGEVDVPITNCGKQMFYRAFEVNSYSGVLAMQFLTNYP